MRIRNIQDFCAGLMFAFFGAGFAWGAIGYRLGTTAQMGPGYFPLVLGGALTALGLIIAMRGFLSPSANVGPGPISVRPAVLVFGALGSFALLIRTAGLVVAVFAVVLVSSRASGETRFREALVSASVLAVLSVVVFVYFLDLVIPVWPVFLTP